MIAGASFWRIYFRSFNGAIKGPQLVEFLRALTATIHGKLLIIWDGLPAHRSRVVRECIESLDAALRSNVCPATRWNSTQSSTCSATPRQRELANLCLATIAEVKRYATRLLKSLQRRPT